MIVSEYAGETILRMVEKGDKLTPSWVCDVSIQLIQSYQRMVSLNIIHNDMKADNICVANDSNGSPHVTIIDFGLCTKPGKVLYPTAVPEGCRINQYWMAPEILEGHAGNYSSDMYSLGVLFDWLFNLYLPQPLPHNVRTQLDAARHYCPSHRPHPDVLLNCLEKYKDQIDGN
ncbi:hypothetical protein Pmani_023531 [Petrolisthes manimaculis]|uniref:Protein kinase domain-containing protein n=1 Tax=Petrolisthes manimaculis TaxID=1843537 RepID=A0AAE1P9E6_9EUCA|nr:hypothetical protein Pmani_023531 [Petrolisthes manimaculis]